jgi:hypothetical protein
MALQSNVAQGQGVRTPSDIAVSTDACAMIAAARVSGFSDTNEKQWLADCGRHPNGDLCRSTKKFIEDSTKRPMPDLICQGKVGHPMIHVDDQPPPGPNAQFDDACSMLTAARISGFHDVNEPDWIANCARHPDQSICQKTKKYIEDGTHRQETDLVCGKN